MVDTVSITKQKPSGHLTKAFRTVVSNRFFLILTIAGFSLVSVEEQLTNYIGVRMDNEISDPTPLLPYFSFEVDGVNLIGMLKNGQYSDRGFMHASDRLDGQPLS